MFCTCTTYKYIYIFDLRLFHVHMCSIVQQDWHTWNTSLRNVFACCAFCRAKLNLVRANVHTALRCTASCNHVSAPVSFHSVVQHTPLSSVFFFSLLYFALCVWKWESLPLFRACSCLDTGLETGELCACIAPAYHACFDVHKGDSNQELLMIGLFFCCC